MTTELTMTSQPTRTTPTLTQPPATNPAPAAPAVRPFVAPSLVKVGKVATITQGGLGGSLDFP